MATEYSGGYTVYDDDFTKKCYNVLNANWSKVCAKKSGPLSRMHNVKVCDHFGTTVTAKAQCYTPYRAGELDSCLNLGSCHKYIKDQKRPEYKGSRERNIKWQLVSKNIEYPFKQNKGILDYYKNFRPDYDKVLLNVCDNIKNEYEQKTGCNSYFRDDKTKFSNKIMTYCSQNKDMTFDKFCQDNKDSVSASGDPVATAKEVKSRNILFRNEYDLCPDNNFYRRQECITASKHKNLPHSVASLWDTKWQKYCVDVKKKMANGGTVSEDDEVKCSCYLTQDEVDNNPYVTDVRCLSHNCKSDSRAYIPYSLRSQKAIPCPNVCVQTIKGIAGKISIIKNINLVQNCFNANEKQEIKKIQEAIDKDIGEGVHEYAISLAIIGKDDKIPSEYKTDNIVVSARGSKDNTFSLLETYSFVESIKAGKEAFKEVYDELVDYMNTKAIDAYEKLHSIDWGDTSKMPSDLKKQYIELLDKAQKILSPLGNYNVALVDEGDTIKGLVDEYLQERNRMAKEAELKINNFLSAYPDYPQQDLLRTYLDKFGKLEKLTDYQSYLDTIASYISDYEDQMLSRKEKIDKARDIYMKIKAMVPDINKIENEDNQKYLDEWSNLMDDDDDSLYKNFDKLSDFIARLDSFLKTREERHDPEPPTPGPTPEPPGPEPKPKPGPEPEEEKHKKYLVYILIALLLLIFLIVGAAGVIALRKRRKDYAAAVTSSSKKAST
jgi:hypothetical protein